MGVERRERERKEIAKEIENENDAKIFAGEKQGAETKDNC